MRLSLVLTTASLGLALAACEPASEAPPAARTPPTPEAPVQPAPDSLSAEGYGSLRIGMTLAQVEQAMGPDSDSAAVGGPEPEACDQFRPERAPEGLLVMIEQGVLTRISVSEPSTLRTDRGFGIGSTAAEVSASYGDAASVEPHHYVGPPAQYITVWSGGARNEPYVQDPAARGVRYETDENGVVTLIHVGGPSIQYVEGCA